MCGIAGWFSSNNIAQQELATLEKMMHSIKHRGPDDQGTALFPHASFGHVRLSIIDLDNGRQPMTSNDGRFTIIFNGEIYNYQQLRKELIAHGHQFITNSDTEVIMEVYRRYDLQGLSRLRGMYAFALWDKQENCGLLARDPLGIKPLFFHKPDDTELVFASEAKAILTKLKKPAALDTAQLHLLLNYRYIPGDGTLFKGIKQLSPGTVVRWYPHKAATYHAIEIPASGNGSTLEQLRDSVYNHLTADVEVGCYLSGGIDSSTIAVLSAEHTRSTLRTFTIDVGDDPGEAQHAAETASQFGFQNFQLKIGDGFTQDLNNLLWHLEVPKINALQNWQLAKFTSQHVKVALSGLGGDELFLGYNFHKIMAQVTALSDVMPSFMGSIIGSSLKKVYKTFTRLNWSEGERSLDILQQLGNWPEIYGLIRNVWDSPELRTKIYGEKMLNAQLPNAFEFVMDHWPQDNDPVMAAAQFEWRQKMVNDLLWQEDRVSMAHGLEVRTPMVDSVFYSHMKNFSRDVLMRKNIPKAYMREIVAPLIPKNILDRPKSGFQVVSHEFYHKHLAALAAEHLSEQKVKEIGIFNYQFIKHVLGFKPSRRLRWHYFILYFMLLTHMWIQLFESNAWHNKNVPT